MEARTLREHVAALKEGFEDAEQHLKELEAGRSEADCVSCGVSTLGDVGQRVVDGALDTGIRIGAKQRRQPRPRDRVDGEFIALIGTVPPRLAWSR